MHRYIFFIFTLAVSCVTLSPQGAFVKRLYEEESPNKRCKFIADIDTEGDRPREAEIKARNKTARLGGDTLKIDKFSGDTSTNPWTGHTGTSHHLMGRAYQCRDK